MISETERHRATVEGQEGRDFACPPKNVQGYLAEGVGGGDPVNPIDGKRRRDARGSWPSDLTNTDGAGPVLPKSGGLPSQGYLAHEQMSPPWTLLSLIDTY